MSILSWELGRYAQPTFFMVFKNGKEVGQARTLPLNIKEILKNLTLPDIFCQANL